MAVAHVGREPFQTHWDSPEVGPRPRMEASWQGTNRPHDLGSHAPLLGQPPDAVLDTLLDLESMERAR
jgi:hypothetical protein